MRGRIRVVPQCVRENALSLFFFAIFLVAVAGQSVAGHRLFNTDAVEHGEATISWGRYLLTSEFGAALLENWQSEYLQFSLFVAATIWLVQKGSNESKALEDAGRESATKQRLGPAATAQSPLWARVGGWRTTVYSNSLLIAMTAIFVISWGGQSLTGQDELNHEREAHAESAVSWFGYITSATFWERTLENWQSEFLAVGSMVVFTIYLRQRGSPESKPVGAPHDETATSG